MPRHSPQDPGRSESDAEDVLLMRLVGRGDTAAFEELIERHQSLVAARSPECLGATRMSKISPSKFSFECGKARDDMWRARNSRRGCSKSRATSFSTNCDVPNGTPRFRFRLNLEPKKGLWKTKRHKRPTLRSWRLNFSRQSIVPSRSFPRASAWRSSFAVMRR